SVAADILRRAWRWRALERKKISLLNLLVMILLFGSVGTESVAAQEKAIQEMNPAAKQVAGSIEEALAHVCDGFRRSGLAGISSLLQRQADDVSSSCSEY